MRIAASKACVVQAGPGPPSTVTASSPTGTRSGVVGSSMADGWPRPPAPVPAGRPAGHLLVGPVPLFPQLRGRQDRRRTTCRPASCPGRCSRARSIDHPDPEVAELVVERLRQGLEGVLGGGVGALEGGGHPALDRAHVDHHAAAPAPPAGQDATATGAAGPKVLVSNMARRRSMGKFSSGPLPEMAALLTMASSSPASSRARRMESSSVTSRRQPHERRRGRSSREASRAVATTSWPARVSSRGRGRSDGPGRAGDQDPHAVSVGQWPGPTWVR